MLGKASFTKLKKRSVHYFFLDIERKSAENTCSYCVKIGADFPTIKELCSFTIALVANKCVHLWNTQVIASCHMVRNFVFFQPI